MKNLLILITIMLVGGCGKDKEAKTKTKVTEDNNATKPVKELTLEEKVVGTYEGKIDGYAVRLALLDNGVLENYEDGKKRDEAKWKIVDGDIHCPNQGSVTGVLIINKDGSLSTIARIGKDGKRRDIPKEDQLTFKKIK